MSDTWPHFPNGLPHPTFLNVDEDGCLYIEWCLGTPEEDERVSFGYDLDEGPFCIHTQGRRDTFSQASANGKDAALFLVKALTGKTRSA